MRGGSRASARRLDTTLVRHTHLRTSHASHRWLELPLALHGRSCATWNLLWTWRPPKVNYSELLPWQRVNHFPNARNLTRKDLLKKHLQRARQLRGDAFDIMPLTYALPQEYLNFVDSYSRVADESDGSPGSNVWIMKPVPPEPWPLSDCCT